MSSFVSSILVKYLYPTTPDPSPNFSCLSFDVIFTLPSAIFVPVILGAVLSNFPISTFTVLSFPNPSFKYIAAVTLSYTSP